MKHIVFAEGNTGCLIALQASKELGYYVTFIQSPHFVKLYRYDPAYERTMLMVDNVVTIDDSLDEDELCASLASIAAAKPIDALITTLEDVVLPLAQAASRLGIPFTNPQGVRNARHKGIMRTCLQNKGLNNIPFIYGDDQAHLIEAARHMKYPLIFKPACGTASLFIKKSASHKELVQAFADYNSGMQSLDRNLQKILSRQIILEAYLEGEMFSLEIAVLDHHYYPLALTERKQYKRNDCIELGATMPVDFPDDVKNKIYKYAVDALQAMELDLGIFHIEMIMSDNGAVVTDLNPRIIGGLAPQLLSLSLGKNIYELLIDVHLRSRDKIDTQDFTPNCYATDRDLASAEDCLYPENVDLTWLEAYRDKGLYDFKLFVKPGDRIYKISSNEDFFGSLIVTAKTAPASKHLAEEILCRLKHTFQIPLILE